MSDFFTSLAARNLSPSPEMPATDGGTVRPRAPAAFEPEAADVPPASPEPSDEVAQTDPADSVVAPRPAEPVQPSRPEADEVRPTGMQDSPPERPLPTPPSQEVPTVQPESPPDTPVAEASPERSEAKIPVLQPRDKHDPPVIAEPAPQPAEKNNGEQGETPSASEPQVIAPQAEPVIVTQKALVKQSVVRSFESHRQPDKPLERIVRQMVLQPIPRAREPERLDDGQPPGTDAEPDVNTAPAETIVEPSPTQTEPVTRSRQIQRDGMPLRPRPAVERRAPQLAPVPDPPAPVEAKAPETTIRISIGRIEVRTDASEPHSEEARPTRPEPTLMSLDDYLKSRSSGGGS